MSEIAKHWIDGEWVGSETVSESAVPGLNPLGPQRRFLGRPARADAEPFPGLSSTALT
jgi:hypothetical protein